MKSHKKTKRPTRPKQADGQILQLIMVLKGSFIKEAIAVAMNCGYPEIPVNHTSNEKLNIYGPFQNWTQNKKRDGNVLHHSSARLGKD